MDYQAYKRHPEYMQLSGAGRKRFWILVKQKVPPDDALLVASKRWSDLRRTGQVDKGKKFKRNMENMQFTNSQLERHAHFNEWFHNKTNQTPNSQPNTGPKHQPNSMPQNQLNQPTNNTQQDQPDCRASESQVQKKPKVDLVSQVAIHNTQDMTEEQMKVLHDALLLEISKCDLGTGPRFYGFSHKAGWVLVTCENYDSQRWLASKIQEIKPWPNAELSIKKIYGTQLSATIFVPNTEADTPEKVLKLLQIQNKGLNTEEWHILKVIDYEGGKVITFSIDEFSMQALKESKFRAILGFKSIYFKMLAEPAATTNTNQNGADELPQLEQQVQMAVDSCPSTSQEHSGGANI